MCVLIQLFLNISVGGAVELVLTGDQDDNSSTDELPYFDANSTTPSHPVSIKMLGYLSLIGNTFCTVSYHHPIVSLLTTLLEHVLFQAVYLLIQKRFIFNKPKSKKKSDASSCESCLRVSLLDNYYADKWRQYPIYVTAYSYFFGALFMGIGPIYYAAAGKYDQFTLTNTVSQLINCIVVGHFLF